jgi:hypothetical protein
MIAISVGKALDLPEYEIWVVDDYNRISETHVVVCATDMAALDAAFAYAEASGIEVWREGRCILTLETGALPLDVIWTGLS